MNLSKNYKETVEQYFTARQWYVVCQSSVGMVWIQNTISIPYKRKPFIFEDSNVQYIAKLRERVAH